MLSEIRFVKSTKFFERNYIVKKVTFFASFCRLWDFLQENLKNVLGHFTQYNFKIFRRRRTMVADNFLSPPNIKTLPTALYLDN